MGKYLMRDNEKIGDGLTFMILDGECFGIVFKRILENHDVMIPFDPQNYYKEVAKYSSSSIMEVKPFPFFS